MTSKQYKTIIIILSIIIVLSVTTIINKRWIGQRIQSLTGTNPFIDYMPYATSKYNNPLNIRHSSSNKWMGEIVTPETKNGDYARFDTLEHGIRAAIINLHTYVTHENANTINKIINKWAPASDGNDPSSYEKIVMEQLTKIYPSLTSTTVLDGNYAQLAIIAWAMAKVEDGKYQPAQQTFIDVQKKYF